MSELTKNINIQVYGNKAQLSIANGFNTTAMTHKEMQQLVNDAIKAEKEMQKATRVNKSHLKVVGQ